MVTKFTTIRVSTKTKENLRALRLTEGESYENIIIRLMESKIGKLETIRYRLSSKDYPFSVDYLIDWGSESKNLCFLDGDDNEYNEVPLENLSFGKDDKLYPPWLQFKDYVEGLDNLVRISSVLEFDDTLDVGFGVLRRLS